MIDPWGGSFYVECLTYDLAKRAWDHIREVEELGGMAKAIEAGLPKHVEEAAAKTQARIDSGRQAVIGANRYRPGQDARVKLLEVDNAAVRQLQIEKLARLKRERDPEAVAQTLAALTRTAGGGNENLLALAVDAARAKATVGEISSALKACSAGMRPRSKPSPACTKPKWEHPTPSSGYKNSPPHLKPTKAVGHAASSPRLARMVMIAVRR